MKERIRRFLESKLPSADGLDGTVAATGLGRVQLDGGWVYDDELGFKHTDAIHTGDGINGTNTFYSYEEDGARRIVNFADRPRRIHTYGDSFTHCDQVNDGETWQEAVAAHLQEPVLNYGVGGYSVYQAYRRMRRVRRQPGGDIAEFIILNIFDDDHYRNLISWLRPGRSFSLARPHLRVNVAEGKFVERNNPIPSAARVHDLRDLDFVCSEFAEDPMVYLSIAVESATAGESREAATFLSAGCERLGVAVPDNSDVEKAVDAAFTRAALASTRHVVELVGRFCAENAIALMFVLSYRDRSLRSVLAGGERYDRDFAAWLKDRGKPVVDMCEAFKTEYDHAQVDLDDFVKRYYIGHHTPSGNNYTAWTVMDPLVDLLDPKPVPYRPDIGTG